MISKKDFLEFVSRIERTEKGISKIEDAFEGFCLREHDFCALSNYAAQIAYFMLGFKEKKYFESFSEDFWNMIDKGQSAFEGYEKGLLKEKVNLMCWEEFYNYYKKVSEENDA